MSGYTAHTSVLLEEAIESLNIQVGGTYVDATFGAGGHTSAMLNLVGPEGRVVAFDRDPEAIANGQQLLEEAAGRLILINANFSAMAEELAARNISQVDGILADLGVSTHQLLAADRGFSAKNSGPVDMRMGPDAQQTAIELLRTADEQNLVGMLLDVDEKPQSARRIVRQMKALVNEVPVPTTAQLAAVIQRAAGAGRPNVKDPTNRVFLALRMAVNDEMPAVDTLLKVAPKLLKVGGRLAVISFHSLEDRHVKQGFRNLCAACICPPKQPVCTCGGQPRARLLTRKGITPSAAELEVNHRSRSATLRAIEMLRPVDAN